MAATTGGRRSVPPGERPIASVAVGKRRERPRPWRANLAPRSSTGSLTPHVLVSMSKTGAARMATESTASCPADQGVFAARGNRLNAVGAGDISPAWTRRFRRGMPTLRTGILRGAKSRVKAALTAWAGGGVRAIRAPRRASASCSIRERISRTEHPSIVPASDPSAWTVPLANVQHKWNSAEDGKSSRTLASTSAASVHVAAAPVQLADDSASGGGTTRPASAAREADAQRLLRGILPGVREGDESAPHRARAGSDSAKRELVQLEARRKKIVDSFSTNCGAARRRRS